MGRMNYDKGNYVQIPYNETLIIPCPTKTQPNEPNRETPSNQNNNVPHFAKPPNRSKLQYLKNIPIIREIHTPALNPDLIINRSNPELINYNTKLIQIEEYSNRNIHTNDLCIDKNIPNIENILIKI
jgi:hypothetical protein